MFYRAGRAGLNAIEQGQYAIGTEVIQSLSASFASIQDLLALQPRYESRLFAFTQLRILAAADASCKQSVSNAGFLVLIKPGTLEESRADRVFHIPNQL